MHINTQKDKGLYKVVDIGMFIIKKGGNKGKKPQDL